MLATLKTDERVNLENVIAELFSRFPFDGERHRHTLLRDAGLESLALGLNLSDAPQAVAGDLVSSLERYGFLPNRPGYHALGALLSYLLTLEDLQRDDAAFIARLIVEHSLVEDLHYIHKLREQYSLGDEATKGILDVELEEVAFGLEFEEEVAEAAEEEEPELPPRYADFAFYKEAQPQKRSDQPVAQGHVLKADHWYQLEVAVREKPTGIPTRGERRPIREPKQKDDVILYIAAEGDGFEIEEPVQTLILPPRGDSKENAYFRVRPQQQTFSPGVLAAIRIRIYYKFNLLEVVDVEAEVVSKRKDDTKSRLGLEDPITFELVRLDRDFDDMLERAMHIDITRQGDTYLMHFAFWNDAAQKVEFTAPARLTKADLESSLLGLRKVLLGIAMSDMYGEQLEGDETEFTAHMRHLAHLGQGLWGKLFKSDRDSALWHIGNWLGDNLKSDGIIQVSFGNREAATFVFPWNLIFDKDPDESDLPTLLEGFWGLRYVIEQRVPDLPPQSDEPTRLENGFEIGFMLWPFEPEAALQRELIENLVTRGHGQIATGAPITTAKAAYDLLSNCMSHILYFYSHGYSRLRDADIGGLMLDDFIEFYENQPLDSPLRKKWKGQYIDIKRRKFEVDRSWIGLGIPTTKLYLDKLYGSDAIDLRNTNPIVLLNMCESAQVTPSLSDSFIHFFIDRGARCVIGTECSMTPLFAHHFSEEFFEALLSDDPVPVGQALLNARRRFVEFKNPLGLAYTLFGSATARFERKSLGEL